MNIQTTPLYFFVSQPRKIFLIILVLFLMLLLDYRPAQAIDEIPVEGAVYSVLRHDGSQKTYLDVVIGHEFKGKLPDDIDSISVSGPSGALPLSKENFNYNPQWRSFWIALTGFPEIGKYTFKVTSGKSSGLAADTQLVNRVIPTPDVSQFSPTLTKTDVCPTTTFSWPLITAQFPLYYQLEIRDGARHIFRTEYIRDMSSLRIPSDTIKPGVEYRWRIRVADGPNWLAINNRTQSRWIKFIPSTTTQSCAYTYNPPIQINDGWEVSSLQAEGIDENTLKTLMIKILDEEIKNIHSVLIIKNGKLVLEEYFGGYALNALHSLASVSKSITSILIGIALEQGHIASVDSRMYELLPSYKDNHWDTSHKNIRLKHVLSMTAGLDWNDWQFPDGDIRDTTTAMSRSENWIKFTLNRETVETPGEKFVYNNGLSLILGEIIKDTTGFDADEFANKYLFRHLDITDYRWRKAKNGIIQTAGGLEMRPRDMAKIGSLMLNDGTWHQRQIVPSRWVQESTDAYLKSHILLGSGYGYQWWRGESFIGEKKIELFYAAGKGGQYIFICPELDLVTVVTSEVQDNPMGEYRPQMMMVNYVIPAALPHVSPKTASEFKRVNQEKYVGNYYCSTYNMKVKIINDDNQLSYIGPENEKGKLHCISENQYVAESNELGKIRVTFFKNTSGEVTHSTLQVGFGFWQFEKTD